MGTGARRPDLSVSLELAAKDFDRLDVRVQMSGVEREGLLGAPLATLGAGPEGTERLELRPEPVGLGGDTELRPAPRALLAEFVELTEAESVAILAFARRWGLLGICSHGRPASHFAGCAPCFEFVNDTPVQWEPIEAWRRYARLAQLLLEITADMADERVPTQDTWDALCAAFEPIVTGAYRQDFADLDTDVELIWIRATRNLGEPSAARPKHDPHQALAACLRLWMRYGRVHLTVQADDERRVELALAAEGLFGHLGLQLISVISGRTGLYRCDMPTCGRLFKPLRTPQRGRNHFCQVHSKNGRASKLAWWNKHQSRYRPTAGKGKDGDGETG